MKSPSYSVILCVSQVDGGEMTTVLTDYVSPPQVDREGDLSRGSWKVDY